MIYYKNFFIFIALLLVGCIHNATNTLMALSPDIINILSYSDKMAATEAKKFMQVQDKNNNLAPLDNTYTKRLHKIAKQYGFYDKNKFNFAVYLNDEVNAFATASGDIRFYKGIMDKMTDKELAFVMLHEIAHVKFGHSKKQQLAARSTITALKGLSHIQFTRWIPESIIGKFGTKAILARFSQQDELDSDKYAIITLKQKNINPNAAVSALNKLSSNSKNPMPWLSSHPTTNQRIESIKKHIK